MKIKHCTGQFTPGPRDSQFVDYKTVYYVTGDETKVLRSDSFGSCVGMVLYHPEKKKGLVAHFWGIEEHPAAAAEQIARDFLDYAEVKPGPDYDAPDEPVAALVFPGVGGGGQEAKSKARASVIANTLKTELPISVRQEQAGHSAVSIAVKNGDILGKPPFAVKTLGRVPVRRGSLGSL